MLEVSKHRSNRDIFPEKFWEPDTKIVFLKQVERFITLSLIMWLDSDLLISLK